MMNDSNRNKKCTSSGREHLGISPTSNQLQSSYSNDNMDANNTNDDRSPSSSPFDHNNVLGNSKNMRFFDVDVEGNERREDIDVDDIDDGHVHDQLHTVEEIKMRSHFDFNTSNERQKNKKLWYILWGTVLLISVFSLGGVLIGKRNQHQKAIISVTQTVRLSHPGAFTDPKSPQSLALRWMLREDSLRLPLPLERNDRFVQRYVVAVLVFAVTTKPPSGSHHHGYNYDYARQKFGLLSASHECEWNSDWNLVDVDNESSDVVVNTKTVKLGIICGDGNGNDNNNDNDNDNDNDTDNIENTSVTAILFPRAGLHGELPPELEVLEHLVKVDLANNEIRGKVPAMPYLTDLSLAYNELTGYMPDHFSEMTRLRTLSLSENALQGSIPRKFAALTDLEILALNGNELTGGLAEIYSLTRLEELYLAYNSFEDRLSNGSFQDLSNLKVIDMKNNRISGPLPDALWKLTNLEVIDFHKNAIDGHINDVIVEDHPLKYLDVSSNLLGGGLPSSINNLRALTHLDLSYNRLERRLPTYLKDMTKMKTLLFTEDDGFGAQPIPDWLRGMTDLQQLSFRLATRTGTIPTWFGELTRLELLDLDWNRISGTIPTELGQLTNLKYLLLNRNQMTGTIPNEVSFLPRLKILMVDNNSFTGKLLLGDEVYDDEERFAHCPASPIQQMIADCGIYENKFSSADSGGGPTEVVCPCCTDCCWEDAERCNMEDYLIQLEDEYRSGYDRYTFSFDDTSYVPAAV